MKILGKNFIFIVGLLAVTVLFFLPYWQNGTIPYAGDFTGSDLTELNLPLRFLAGQSFLSGQIPLWTNFLANGFPLLAEGQAGVFYPFNLVFFTLFPFGWAVNLSLMANFFLAGVFFYYYCRSLKVSQAGSFFAALAFSFSGFFIFRLKHLNLINAAIWLPLELFLIEKYFSSKKKSLIVIILSLVFAVQFFAGHPQILYISLLAVGIYFYLKAWLIEGYKFSEILTKLVWPWVIIGALLFGLTAIQLLPTLFYSALSGRSLAMGYSAITDFPFQWFNLFYFFSPYYFGNPAWGTYPLDTHTFGIFWENNIYFGLAALILALTAIKFLFAKIPAVKFLTILLLISGLFVLGDKNPIFLIFWEIIPGFQMFRFWQRFLLLTLVCLAALSGFGFDFILAKLRFWQEKYNLFKKSKILVKFLLPAVLILILAIDLFLVAFKYLGALDYKKYFSAPQSAQFLQSDQDNFRIYSLAWPGAWQSIYQLSGGWQNNLSLLISGRELIWPNLNVFSHLASAQDRASLEGGMLPKEAQILGNKLMLASWLSPNNQEKIKISDQTLKIFGLENVKYLLAFKEVDNANLILTKEISSDFLPKLRIYKSNHFLPFAFGVFETKTATTTAAMFDLMFDPGFVPAKQIILLQNQAKPLDSFAKGLATVEIVKQSDDKFLIKADFSQPGYLFLSQNFVPGWQAKIDQRSVEIIRANGAFSAVYLPAGKHQINFVFRPISFVVGCWITFITLVLLMVYLLFYASNLIFKKRNSQTN